MKTLEEQARYFADYLLQRQNDPRVLHMRPILEGCFIAGAKHEQTQHSWIDCKIEQPPIGHIVEIKYIRNNFLYQAIAILQRDVGVGLYWNIPPSSVNLSFDSVVQWRDVIG